MSEHRKTKKCKACGKRKKTSEFYKQKTNPDGLFGKCKACISLDRAAYYVSNKDKIKNAAMEWQNSNHDRHLHNRAVWREKNRELLREQDAVYRAKKSATV